MNTSLKRLINDHGWMEIPNEAVSAEGWHVDTSVDDWKVLLPGGARGLLFSKVENPYIRWALKRYALNLLITTSSHAAVTLWDYFSAFINNRQEYWISADLEGADLADRLAQVLQEVIAEHRAKHSIWHTYRLVQWYIWCADNIPHCGFDPVYADELAAMKISGGPKGEAVRAEDPERGPLCRTREQPLLLDALHNDISTEYRHLQEKAALALCLAFGRNPLNLSWLNENDLYNLTAGIDQVDPCYMLRIPRIKKRQKMPRNDFCEEKLDQRFAGHVSALIEANASFENRVLTHDGLVTVERPLFRLRRPRRSVAVAKESAEWVLRLSPGNIGELISDFVVRNRIVSPVTDLPLSVTPRRLRYTLATSLVEEGISRRELAAVLDHSDTQHVEVYFELASNVVRYLDAAMAKGMSRYFDHFKGTLIDNDSEAVNGDRADKHLSFVGEADPTDQTEIGVCGHAALCDLDPPFSCYLCPLFQPYRHADHEHVLDLLIQSRESRMAKYENSRLGVQMDDVIFAVGRVVEACEDPENG